MFTSLFLTKGFCYLVHSMLINVFSLKTAGNQVVVSDETKLKQLS